MNFKIIFLILLFSIISRWSCGTEILSDTIRPEVRKPCPDFILTHVTNYPKKQVTLNDFKGKWLFLDFWSTTCKACIKSFPKVNDLQQEFKDQMNWVMVGISNIQYNRNEDVNAIETFYERLRSKQDLKLISAYDSVLYGLWKINSLPHIYIIDPEGMLKFITDGRDITKEKLRKMLEGESVSFFDKKVKGNTLDVSANFDSKSNDLLIDNKSIYRSIITQWSGERQRVYDIDQYIRAPAHTTWKEGFKLTMVPLYWLYNAAYFGKCYMKNPLDPMYGEVYPFPVLEVRDTSLFEFDYKTKLGKGLYNYVLKIPSLTASRNEFMQYMQEDLRRTFMYNAFVEVREMPVWKLVAKPEAEKRISTKGGVMYNSERERNTAAGFSVRNVSIKSFLVTLSFYLNGTEVPPFIDETNIVLNVDITINADLANLKDVRNELQKYGLDLIKGYKKMKTLVIRE